MPTDRLDELAVLVAIIDNGSLTRAAQRLRRSRPGVTRALAQLEGRAGQRLIERSTRRLAPTEAGRALAEKARALLGDYQAAIGGLEGAPLRGLLRVTAPVQFGRRHVAPVVASFLDRYAEIQVELVLNDRNLDLIEEGIDVALRIGSLPDSGLIARRLGEVRRVLVASPAYLKRHGMPKRPADLTGHDTVFASTRPGSIEWRFGEGRRGAVVRLAPRLIVNDVESLLVAVKAGRGIGRPLSYQVADELKAGTLVRLLASFEPPPLPVQLLAPGGQPMAAKLRAFLDHAVQELRRLPVLRAKR